MLSLVDLLLRAVLMEGVPSLRAHPTPPPPPAPPSPPLPVSDTQIRFQPPDGAWRSYVDSLSVNGAPANAMNVYLVEIRENRQLRSNQRVRTVENGIVTHEQVPAQLDCHYVISAWSRDEVTTGVEPALDQHQLLYEATAALMHASPLSPARVYAPGSPELGVWPERFRQAELPTTVAPPDGFLKLAEFWGSMGTSSPWRPVLYLTVTVPVELLRQPVGPLVTTTVTRYGTVTGEAMGATWVQIGGRVWNDRAAPAEPVAGAWVQLESAAGEALQTTHADGAGRFSFAGLRPDSYRLRVRAVGLGEASRTTAVPSPGGEYDLRFV